MKHESVLCVTFSALLWQAVGVAGELPPLIPREVLLGNPDKASPQISPDGRRLTYIAPYEGVLNVWVRTIGSNDDRVITKDRKRGIRAYFWAANNRQIIYVQDKAGDENWHLYAVDLETGDIRDLTPFQDVRARVIAVEQKFPNEILVAINNRTPELYDIYRVDLDTGKLTLELENTEDFVVWVADHDLRVRAAAKLTPAGGLELRVRDNPTSPWRTLTTWGPEDTLNSGPIRFTPDAKSLYLVSSKGTNTGELRETDLVTGTEETLASDPHADLAEVLIHPTNHTFQAVAYNKERIHWKVLDKSIKKDFRAIRRIRRGDFDVIDRDHADQTWLVSFETDDGPVSYYAYDRGTRKAEFLFTDHQGLENVTLAKMEPSGFRARDNLFISGYLTTPPGIRPTVNLPLVLLVNRGPWSRSTWGYDGTAQWLANRGYAVLQVNFRGSSGYGKAFVNASRREWGGKMQDDLIDGVNWAIKHRIADPKRIAIFGYSYGGYAALMGLASSPDVFCCGVDICGPANLITYIKTLPPYLKPIEPLVFDRVGHPERDAEFLESRSPLFMADRITKPLLIAQGANDPHVKKSESLRMVEALKKAGKVVEYVEYPDEGHGFARPENRLDFYAKAEKFLARHLGGRYEE